MATALSDKERALMDAYWHAANYLSVGQIYLYDNPLLKRTLTEDDIKPRLLGHWGTTPGLNFIYAHLNRVIKARDLNMIYICGPGHGGPGMTANTKVVAARRDNVIRIPDQALRYKPVGLRAGSGGAQVWVLRDNRPTAVALTLGLDDDSFSEVLSGDLKPGDMLILSEQGGSGGSSGSRPHFFGL